MSIDFRHETGLYAGLYERELNGHIKDLCRPGFACFDVGGYLGYDALVLAKLSRGGRIASFEAAAERCSLIMEAVRANPAFAGQVSVHHAYVGIGPDNVQPVQLDEFAYGPDGFAPDMMKIDIEGAERDALIGASRLLTEITPNLIVEVHSAELERACASLLRDHGYHPDVVKQRSWLPENRPAGSENRWLVAKGRARPRKI